MINLSTHVQFAGHFKLERIKAATGEIVQSVEFDNLITDIGLNRVGTAVATTYCYVSTSTTTPDVLDTSMSGLIAATSTIQTYVSNRTTSTPYWVEQSRTYRFGVGAAAGNISKVGIGWNSTGASGLWSSALVLDTNGTPTTITVLSDEYLDVTYTLRYYPPLTDSTYTVTISGVDYTINSRTADITNASVDQYYMMSCSTSVGVYSGPCVLGAITSGITGSTGNAAGGATANSYVNNSLKATSTATFGLSAGNLTGGITGIKLSSGTGVLVRSDIQMTISPAIPKNNTKTMSLSFEISWGRYTP